MLRRVFWTDYAAAIKAVEEDGAVILKQFTCDEEVEQVNQDAAPVIQEIIRQRAQTGQSPGTARCYHLYGYSSTARETWLQREPIHKLLNHFLRTTCTSFNDDGSTIATNPVLSTATTMCIGPGEKAQTLHRDDFLWQQVHAEIDQYVNGRDMGMGILVAGCQTTEANGATRVIPRSHLWGHGRKPVPGEDIAAELSLGEALCYLSSTVHGGGANVSKNEYRQVHGFFFCRAYLKPEDNQHVFWTKEEVQTWSFAAQKQAGYIVEHPYLGHCGEKNPIEAL